VVALDFAARWPLGIVYHSSCSICPWKLPERQVCYLDDGQPTLCYRTVPATPLAYSTYIFPGDARSRGRSIQCGYCPEWRNSCSESGRILGYHIAGGGEYDQHG